MFLQHFSVWCCHLLDCPKLNLDCLVYTFQWDNSGIGNMWRLNNTVSYFLYLKHHLSCIGNTYHTYVRVFTHFLRASLGHMWVLFTHKYSSVGNPVTAICEYYSYQNSKFGKRYIGIYINVMLIMSKDAISDNFPIFKLLYVIPCCQFMYV